MAAAIGSAFSVVPTPSGYDYGVVLPFRSDHSDGGLLRGDPVRANDPAIDVATNRRPSIAHRHRDPGGGFPCPCGRGGPSSAIANDPCCDGATTSPCGAVRATSSDPCGCAFHRRDRGCGVSTTCRDGHAPCGLRWTHHFQPPAIRPPSCTEPQASPRRQNLRPPSCFFRKQHPLSWLENYFLCRFTGTSSVDSTCRKCRGCWATLGRYF